MPKELLVIKNGRVVYRPGHYDLDGARAVAIRESQNHPKARISVVKIVEQYQLKA